jgi:hypothetical protein
MCMCMCIYDRFITERKWRNKTPLFSFFLSLSHSQFDRENRKSHQINLFQQSRSGLSAVVVNLFFPFFLCMYTYIYLCVLRQSSYYTLRNNPKESFYFLGTHLNFTLDVILISYPEIKILLCSVRLQGASNKEYLKYL